MNDENGASFETWRDAGFTDSEAAAWMMTADRFTPYTAAAWRREGFGPNDAAQWSNVFTDPVAARARRNDGYADPYEREPLAERLVRLRQARGLSEAELAKRAGVDAVVIARMEMGHTRGEEYVAGIRIARALGVAPEYLAATEPG